MSEPCANERLLAMRWLDWAVLVRRRLEKWEARLGDMRLAQGKQLAPADKLEHRDILVKPTRLLMPCRKALWDMDLRGADTLIALEGAVQLGRPESISEHNHAYYRCN